VSTTIEYWDVNGTSLNTLAWNIQTLQGRARVPILRGDDIDIPYRAGQVWRQKFPGPRVLTLAMWVLGCRPDGTVPSISARAQFNENRDALLRLFYSPDAQITLTKRWQMSSGLLVASAKAELVGDMDPGMLGSDGAQFVVDLKLADPYFYAPSSVFNLTLATGTAVLNNPGHDRIRKGTLRFNGPLTNPRLTNTTAAPDIWAQYTGVIAGGNWVELDLDLFTAVNQASTSVLSAITHDGARKWMELLVGNNSLTLSADAGSGNIAFTTQAPYV
jgi:hypothetical protein